ncbi:MULTISPECIES: SDR family NAD(P)-dependent oxidoreductase [Sinorhizobium]|uniref:SDR family NAD(P)-dependent oxidoreductase n=1 Tax=Sinorhizobium TaxID=28105 RepID=UPI000FD860DB|nr:MULTISPECIES: SDR family oxidoreductase [Sinorhizobium]MDX0967291.1 SDR family oxidoreductase [Sinorhizobium medicae]MQV46340.1 SDR family oxidoreductase [Sinorhizobium medicae]MQV54071.1 SDR family oxidoreductase [Sinorhizobium medicae]MQV71710.1 SDR family oxidoreductase [Sinorhizobium medicae]RVK90329.1 SDR family oxidoreductase [Sinorhizobium meliloti]
MLSKDLANPTRLTGKVALVVGGYGAIGTTISEMLAAAGATCIVAGRNGERSQGLAEQLHARGWNAAGTEVDASNVEAVRDLTDRLVKEHGSIDILVNCVGFHKEQPFLEVTEEAFDEVYTKTLRVGMFLSQAVARHQVAVGNGGSQVHLLSVRSSLGFRDRGYSSMCAAKGGLAILMKQQATELAPHQITVNGIAPSAVRTRKNDEVLRDPAALQRAAANIPFGRLATPTDVAGAVLFLASPLAAFVTGQLLYIDGGLTSSA